MRLYYHYILFSVFLVTLMSHSRTSNFTYRLIFYFFLAGKGGGGKKKRRHVVLLLFSLSKGNPGAAAWTWAHSDSDAGWKQDLRPRSLYLTVLRETPPPPTSPVTDQAPYSNESPERYWTASCTWGARRKLAIVCDESHVPKQRDCGFVRRK